MRRHVANSALFVIGLSLVGSACGTQVDTVSEPSGGTSSTGGTSAGTAGSGATGGVPTTGGTGTAGTGTAGTGTAGTGTAGAGGTSGGSGGTSAGGTSGGTGGDGGFAYNPDFEEFSGEDCQVGEPAEANNAKLPDLFESFDGTRIASKADWKCRRAELKKAVETYIHGAKPGKPDMVTGTVSATSVTVNVTVGSKSINFSLPVSLPPGASGPVPAIIGLGGVSSFSGDASLADTVKGEGVATMNYSHGDIANEGSRNGKFTDLYTNTGVSAQVAWAWGISRVIDVLVAERDAGRNEIIDPTAIGITGCSRNGKGAFTIGAFDERIALGLPVESGTGGVSAFRVVNTAPVGPNGKPAQSLSSAWTEAQGWFGSVFNNYRNNVNEIPVDTHSLVAMYAPRGLLVLDNSRIGELGSSAQHAATAAAAEVYKALGVEKNIAYHGGNPSDPHEHCGFYQTQVPALQRAIKAHLTRTAAADGKIEPQPAGTADLPEWIDWQAPVLN
jgi:hypothetical protein